MKYQILNGDNRIVLKTLPDNSIDSVITDPPYGIDFLGKAWDANTGSLETYRECLRVLKPGGHLLAFSAARTYHHLAVTLEQAGFEIRDQIMWIYSSGFPKSQDVGKSIDRAAGKKDPNYGTNKASSVTSTEGRTESSYVKCKICLKGLNGDTAKDCDKDPCGLKYSYQTEAGKQWAGWGSALKPAHEPICLARKPTKLSIAQNVQRWGTGALNIDATRVPYLDIKDMESAGLNWNKTGYETGGPRFIGSGEENKKIDKPAEKKDNINEQGRFPSNVIGEIEEEYQKYFYCPKVSRAERHIGFDHAPDAQLILNEMQAYFIDDQGNKVAYEDRHNVGMVYIPHINTTIPFRHIYDEYTKWKKSNNNKIVSNNHPTVKPVELMKYLIKLVTPPNGIVLDPFNGSGSTGMAAVELGYEYIGIEQDDSYCEISRKRIAAHFKRADPLRASGLFD